MINFIYVDNIIRTRLHHLSHQKQLLPEKERRIYRLIMKNKRLTFHDLIATDNPKMIINKDEKARITNSIIERYSLHRVIIAVGYNSHVHLTNMSTKSFVFFIESVCFCK